MKNSRTFWKSRSGASAVEYALVLALVGAVLIAAVLYRDFSRRRDDVTVVVAKDRPLLAEKQ